MNLLSYIATQALQFDLVHMVENPGKVVWVAWKAGVDLAAVVAGVAIPVMASVLHIESKVENVLLSLSVDPVEGNSGVSRVREL